MGWHSHDPYEDAERRGLAREKEEQDYPGLAEHDAIHEDNGGNNMWGATHRDVHRNDGGGVAHVADRVAHAQSVKDVHGDHSPRATDSNGYMSQGEKNRISAEYDRHVAAGTPGYHATTPMPVIKSPSRSHNDPDEYRNKSTDDMHG